MDAQSNQAAGQSSNVGQEDYVDKGLDTLERKFGGGKVNPETSRGMNEKITDGARGFFEKATGYASVLVMLARMIADRRVLGL
ncbi:MAG: hypothetical protein MMC33_008677 [Icmadophila ericetorum]|nr:hypothetical protein [Icmadophila ericetorum]